MYLMFAIATNISNKIDQTTVPQGMTSFPKCNKEDVIFLCKKLLIILKIFIYKCKHI